MGVGGAAGGVVNTGADVAAGRVGVVWGSATTVEADCAAGAAVAVPFELMVLEADVGAADATSTAEAGAAAVCTGDAGVAAVCCVVTAGVAGCGCEAAALGCASNGVERGIFTFSAAVCKAGVCWLVCGVVAAGCNEVAPRSCEIKLE